MKCCVAEESRDRIAAMQKRLAALHMDVNLKVPEEHPSGRSF